MKEFFVLPRGLVHYTDELTGEMAMVAKTTRMGYVGYRSVGMVQEFACHMNTVASNKLHR